MTPVDIYRQTLLSFLAPVRPFLEDPSVSEIMVNGPFEVLVERSGRIERTAARFDSELALLAALRNLAQYVGRPLDAERPILEGRLPDGSRVEAVLPPIAPDGPIISIRRFPQQRLGIARLIDVGAVSREGAGVLRALVEGKQNILIAGGTGSGKTSLLGALSSFVPSAERVIVIEDARELQLQGDHVVHLEARPADVRGRGKVTVRDLFRATLRLRPDRIVIGEIRGPEALDLVQAMTSGHGGCLSTVHATYPADALSRLETLALMSDVDLPLVALRAQVASAVDIIVQTARLRDGSRCVTHVTEVVGCTPRGGYELSDLFVRRTIPGAEGRSRLISTGAEPRCTEALRAFGVALPSSGSHSPKESCHGEY